MSADSKIYNKEIIETKFMDLILKAMAQFDYYWDEFRMCDEQKSERVNSFLNIVTKYIDELVDDEKHTFDKLKSNIASHKKNIEILSLELLVESVTCPSDLPLVEEERFFKSQLDQLKDEKRFRMKEYQSLLESERILCDQLVIMKTGIEISRIPTATEIFELQESIRMLEKEKRVRLEKYYAAVSTLSTIIELTELTPETSFEREIICYDDLDEDQLDLSKEYLQKVMKLAMKFEEKKKDMEHEMDVLKSKLISLWDRLEVPVEERIQFQEIHLSVSCSSMCAVKETIAKYEEIKRQNIEKFILKMKEELSHLWIICYVPKTEREKFISVASDFSEATMTLYETELERLKTFHFDTKHILDMIRRRSVLWDRMIEFEKKIADPSRLANRGGNLLREEKERKKIMTDLPKLELDIQESIQEYEERTKNVFLVFGKTFEDYLKEQLNEFGRLRDELKSERQKKLKVSNKAMTPVIKRLCVNPASGSRLVRSAKTSSNRFRLQNTPLASKRISPKRTSMFNIPSPKRMRNNNDVTISYSLFENEVGKDSRKVCRSSKNDSMAHGSSHHRPRVVLGSKIRHDGSLKRRRSSKKLKSSPDYSKCSAIQSSDEYENDLE